MQAAFCPLVLLNCSHFNLGWCLMHILSPDHQQMRGRPLEAKPEPLIHTLHLSVHHHQQQQALTWTSSLTCFIWLGTNAANCCMKLITVDPSSSCLPAWRCCSLSRHMDPQPPHSPLLLPQAPFNVLLIVLPFPSFVVLWRVTCIDMRSFHPWLWNHQGALPGERVSEYMG